MYVDSMGGAVPEHIDHMNCRTRVKMDNSWECLTDVPVRFPDLITYGPVKYCVHKDNAGFGTGVRRRNGTL